MASFLSRLFGGGSSSPSKSAGPTRGEPVEYKGYLIQAAPEQQDSQWRVAGVIRKADGEPEVERIFPRADTFATRDAAASFSITQAKPIIDQRGAELFADAAATGPARPRGEVG